MSDTISAFMDRNLAFEMVRATEAAALAAAQWMGRGNKEAADQAAVDAMRFALSSLNVHGVVVIGEGEKDEAPMLYNGEVVGSGTPPHVDVAVDPIDGTTLLAMGLPNAISALAMAERGSLFDPTGIFYMRKIAVGKAACGAIDIRASAVENINRVAEAQRMRVEELTVVILDRPRHDRLISDIRKAGARIKLIAHGDIAGALEAAQPESGIDVLMGIGGAPEAVITGCAMRCLGGDIQCQLWPRNEQDRLDAEARGLDVDRVLTIDDLCATEDAFFAATGITDGELLHGVRYTSTGAHTSSIAMRARSGTVRYVEAIHNLDKLMQYTNVRYRTEF